MNTCAMNFLRIEASRMPPIMPYHGSYALVLRPTALGQPDEFATPDFPEEFSHISPGWSDHLPSLSRKQSPALSEFAGIGTPRGTIKFFRQQGLLFRKGPAVGPQKGKLVWVYLSPGRACTATHNPSSGTRCALRREYRRQWRISNGCPFSERR
jgi:hypothetical protein